MREGDEGVDGIKETPSVSRSGQGRGGGGWGKEEALSRIWDEGGGEGVNVKGNSPGEGGRHGRQASRRQSRRSVSIES